MRNICLILVVLTVGCGKSSQSNNPPIISVQDDDAAMNAAIQKARDTVLTEFAPALKSHHPKQIGHSIKVAIKDGDKVEHLWLTPVTFEGQKFTGKVNNEPKDVKGVKLGTKYSVAPEEISDWMYIDDGKLVGGFSVRVLRDKMPEKERAEFEKGLPFKLD